MKKLAVVLVIYSLIIFTSAAWAGKGKRQRSDKESKANTKYYLGVHGGGVLVPLVPFSSYFSGGVDFQYYPLSQTRLRLNYHENTALIRGPGDSIVQRAAALGVRQIFGRSFFVGIGLSRLHVTDGRYSNEIIVKKDADPDTTESSDSEAEQSNSAVDPQYDYGGLSQHYYATNAYLEIGNRWRAGPVEWGIIWFSLGRVISEDNPSRSENDLIIANLFVGLNF